MTINSYHKMFCVGKIGRDYGIDTIKNHEEIETVCCDNIIFDEKKSYCDNCGMKWFWEY